MQDTVPARLGKLHRAIVEAAPGITSAEYQAFLYVAENEGTSQRDVCQHLGAPQATVSRTLANLNGKGHSLLQCRENGRQHALSLSPKGKQLLARLAVLLGCVCVAPAADSILSQFEIEPAIENLHPHQPGYDACMDPTVFSCDVS